VQKMQLIDSHVHLNFDIFEPDRSLTLARSRCGSTNTLLRSPREFANIQVLAHRFPELCFAVGLHPLDAEKWTKDTANQILALARSDSKVVAIGETGLDFYKADNQEQQRGF